MIAILVAINILWAGVRLQLRTISGLMDATLTEEELAEIVRVLEQFIASDQIAYHALRTRYAGARRFMSVMCWCRGNGLYSKAMICWKVSV